MIKFTVVVVTYADRGHLLLKVLGATIEAGCNHVIIVDNGSSEDSKEKVRNFIISNENLKIKVINNDKNEGSAIAFSQGMDAASSDENHNEFVLFLDDDNYPVKNAIQNALSIANSDDSNNTVYFLMREDRPHYREYIKTLDANTLLGEKNSFMGFTLKSYIHRYYKKLLPQKQSPQNACTSIAVPVPCGPYGGMLTKKSILKQGVRPMKEMILYFDDTKYTFDLSQAGVSMYLLPNLRIRDIDDSWSAKKTSKFSSPIFEAADFKVKYTFRNRVFFENSVTVTNKSTYAINMISYLAILLVKALISGHVKKYIKVIGYIRSGFHFGK